MPGPPPKRSSQRRRQNKGEPITAAVSDGQMRGPDLEGEHSEQAHRFWLALRTSGQAQWFEPSDWAVAELVVVAIDAFVAKPTAFMLTAIHSSTQGLLLTEGDRRRLKIELERGAEESSGDVSWLDQYRARESG